MAYAISDEAAQNAPLLQDDQYVKETDFKEAKYNLYAHRYINLYLISDKYIILLLLTIDYWFVLLFTN